MDLREFPHAVDGNSREPNGARDPSQGSALHEARYGRAAETALGDPGRNKLDPLDRRRRGRKYLFRRGTGQAPTEIRAPRPLENSRFAHYFFALGADLRADLLGIARLQLGDEQLDR